MKKYLFILFLLLPSSTFAFTQGYTGAGFTYSQINTLFCDKGTTQGSHIVLWNATHDLYLYTDVTNYAMAVGLFNDASLVYFVPSNGHNYDDSITWKDANTYGDTTGGFTSTDCDTGSGGDTGTTTGSSIIATTSVNSAINTTNFGLGIIITLMFGTMIASFMNLTTKK